MSFRSFIESLIPEPRGPVYSFKLVDGDHEFKFKKLCPYCKGGLLYLVQGWEQCDFGLWQADLVEAYCSREPDHEELYEWEHWFRSHIEMPYVHQMPVDEAVKRWINARYRFSL